MPFQCGNVPNDTIRLCTRDWLARGSPNERRSKSGHRFSRNSRVPISGLGLGWQFGFADRPCLTRHG